MKNFKLTAIAASMLIISAPGFAADIDDDITMQVIEDVDREERGVRYLELPDVASQEAREALERVRERLGDDDRDNGQNDDEKHGDEDRGDDHDEDRNDDRDEDRNDDRDEDRDEDRNDDRDDDRDEDRDDDRNDDRADDDNDDLS